MKHYLIGAAVTYFGAVLALQSVNCQSRFSQTTSPKAASPSALERMVKESAGRPKTPALRKVERNRDYLVLIDDYDEIKRLSRAVGFSGTYGHIEAVREGRVYGCRPPRCSELSLSQLEQKFSGRPFELREVRIGDDRQEAVEWFRQTWAGQPYDLLYRNCTDAVAWMYGNRGDELVKPVNVETTYATNEPLRGVMKQLGIPKPQRAAVYFPDQFAAVGTLVAKGRFEGQ